MKSLSYVILIVLITVLPVLSQWSQPIFSSSISTLGVDGTNIYAGTSVGFDVLKSTNNGDSWSTIHYSGGYSFQTMNFLFYNSAIYVGTSNGVLISSDGAASWSYINTGIVDRMIYSIGECAGYLYAGSSTAVYRSSNGGSTWSAKNSGLPNDNSKIIHGIVSNDTVIFLGTEYGVFKSTDYGASWSSFSIGLPVNKYSSTTFSVVWAIIMVHDTLYVSCENMGVYKTSINSNNWTQSSTGLTSGMIRAFASDGNIILATTSDAGIFLTTDGGSNWASRNTGIPINNARTIAVSSSRAFTGAFTQPSLYQRDLSDGLPVELTSFQAIVAGNSIELGWKTATEINNYGFTIERMDASRSIWNSIGFVQGKGTSNAPQYYSFIDRNVSNGDHSYRLKQTDRNGEYRYSSTVEIATSMMPDKFTLMQNFPDPFNPRTSIRYYLPKGSYVQLAVVNSLGRVIDIIADGFQSDGWHGAVWNGDNFASGVYFYKLQASGYVDIKKMVLIK